MSRSERSAATDRQVVDLIGAAAASEDDVPF